MENTAKKAYSEILKTLKMYKDICVFDVDDLERTANHHLFGIELKEKYGFDIDPKRIQSLDWVKLGDYMYVSKWGKTNGRTISWPDNDKQPKDELLLQICFSTGAYIFGEDYPQDLFEEFFLELKTYNPSFIDTNNKGLYYSMNNASVIHNKFNSILSKYIQKHKENAKQRQIIKLKADLEKLEQSI